MCAIKLTENIVPRDGDQEDTSITEAIQTIYRNAETWVATMNWNG